MGGGCLDHNTGPQHRTTIQHACLHHKTAHGRLQRLRDRDPSSGQVHTQLQSMLKQVQSQDPHCPQEQAPSEPPQITQERWDRMTPLQPQQQYQYQVSPDPLFARLPTPSLLGSRPPLCSVHDPLFLGGMAMDTHNRSASSTLNPSPCITKHRCAPRSGQVSAVESDQPSPWGGLAKSEIFGNSLSWTIRELPHLLPCVRLGRRTFISFAYPKPPVRVPRHFI